MPQAYNVNKKWQPWKMGPKEVKLSKYPSVGKELQDLGERWVSQLKCNENVPSLLLFLRKSRL